MVPNNTSPKMSLIHVIKNLVNTGVSSSGPLCYGAEELCKVGQTFVSCLSSPQLRLVFELSALAWQRIFPAFAYSSPNCHAYMQRVEVEECDVSDMHLDLGVPLSGIR